jgi:hypothetical protein
MKLQPASKKEIKRIAIGTGAFDLILLAALFVLSLEGLLTFNYTVFLGILVGSCVAILNFTIMCLTIQKATGIDDQKQMKAFIQGSYNGRLMLQAGWVVVAILVPHFQVVASAAPLLFPNLTIFYLQAKGKLVEPSDRKNPPADEQDEPEDRLESFEV